MSDAELGRRITRRTAVRQMAAATAGVAGAVAVAEELASSAGIHVERQSTGAEIWQVTTEEFSQSNIYCEVPYCSRDSRYFVYQRTNPELSQNRTEFLTPDLKWVIFNSNRSGFPHVYAASVPEGMIEEVLEA
ncbi:MAG: hypothetical protein HQ582_09020 [Planctomycetes bacterium]|nr:hypothetical protein [Planctomycetota bacterium]